MKYFEHSKAGCFSEASELLQSGARTAVLAGGTDLLGVLKDGILADYPEELIDIKQIPQGNAVYVNDNVLTIGALAKLKDVAESDVIKKNVPILSEAAKSVATPLIRNMGTIGGNICQDVRCWFYRYPHEGGGRLVCSRKGGDTCYALQGDNRYHSIFGGMKTHVTPCTQECPAKTDIPGYMEQMRKGNVAGAAQIVMRVNPMPMITSRVCAHFCHQKCNRNNNDENVSIGNVERSLGDYILENSEKFYTAPEKSTGKAVAVVGGGPSGLAAAYYLRKAGNDVTVYDRQEEAGGMLMYAIPAYRLPKDIVRKLIKALDAMGIVFKCGANIGNDIKPAELEKQHDSVYYATGAWKRPVIGLAGEELTEFGLDFLIEVNRWMKGKVGTEVLVTGGGNVAMDVAITAKRLGAKKVTMACLEPRDQMPASSEEIARAEEEGVIIMPSWGLSRVIEENGAVKGMELKRCTSVLDEGGAFSPRYDERERIVVNAESILMAVGQRVDLSFLDEKYQMQLNKRGLIDISEETQMTSRKGVFAGGDATTGPATVIGAIADGSKAARGIMKYLSVSPCDECGGMKQSKEKFITLDVGAAQKKEAARLREIPADQRSLDKEDSFSLDMKQAVEEAGRCLNCGCYAVNPSDIAPVLVALDATIVTNQRRVSAEEFCCDKLKVSEQLNPGEIVQLIEIPLAEGAVMHYDKFRLRNSVDFAIVSVSSLYSVSNGKITGAKVVLGGVAPVPIPARELSGWLIGKEVNEQTAETAAAIAVKAAMPLTENAYKVVELQALIKNSILRL